MYAIIGGNGFLGSYVIRAILNKTDEIIIATSRNLESMTENKRIKWIKCDVQADQSVDTFLNILSAYKNIKLLYLAAYHHPDKVEENKTLAWDINVTCLSKFINKASFVSKIIYASTDNVYGESVNGYRFREQDALKPVNFYGHNKCASEAVTIHLGRNVVRLPFLISPSIVEKPHFYDVIVENIKAGKTFEMFDDSYRSSLSFENAGRILVDLFERGNIPSVVNVCGDEALSKYDVGRMIAKREGLNPGLILPISTEKSQENFRVKRAKNTLMDNVLLKETLGLEYIDIFDEPTRARISSLSTTYV